MKTLSKIRQENKEEFEKAALEKKSILAREGIVGVPILFEEIEIKSIVSSVESRIIEAIREWAESKKEIVRHHESCLNKEYGGNYCDCGHPDQWRTHNKVLSDLLSFLQEADKK